MLLQIGDLHADDFLPNYSLSRRSDSRAPGEAREALFRDERCGFILYLSDGLAPSEPNEKIIRLDTREALIWLNQTSQDEELFCG